MNCVNIVETYRDWKDKQVAKKISPELIESTWIEALRSKRTGARLDAINAVLKSNKESMEIAVAYNNTTKTEAAQMLDIGITDKGNYMLFTHNGSYEFKPGSTKSLPSPDSKVKYLYVPAMAVLDPKMMGSDAGGIRPGQDAGDTLKTTKKILEQDVWDMFSDIIDMDIGEGVALGMRTAEFQQFQGEILDNYASTMAEAGMDGMTVEMYENAVLATSGEYDYGVDTVRIRWNKMSRTARASEILLHEVGHKISKDVFGARPDILQKVIDLREALLETGITYEIFLGGLENPTKTEIEIAKEKFEYVFDKKSADPQEFWAYVTSNENVWLAVKDIKIKNAQLIKSLDAKDGSVAGKLINKLIDIINTTWRALTGRGVKGRQLVADLMVEISKVAVETAKDSVETELAETDPDLLDKIEQKTKAADYWISEKLIESEDRIIALAGKGTRRIDKMLGKLQQVRGMNKIVESGVLQYLWNTLTMDTTKADVRDMFAIFRGSKNAIEKHTSGQRDAIKRKLNEMYEGLDNRQKEAIKDIVVDLDIKALGNIDKIHEMLGDADKRAARRAELWSEVKSNVRLDEKQIKGLAHYLVTGEVIEKNQQMNATNIVGNYHKNYRLINTDGTEESAKEIKKVRKARRVDILSDLRNPNTVKMVDELVTLEALELTDKDKLNELQKLLNEDGTKAIVDDTIVMYKNYIEQLEKDAKVDIYNPIRKGYTKTQEGRIKYKLVPVDEVEAELKVNMQLVGADKLPLLQKIKRSTAKDMYSKVKPYVVVEGKPYYMMVGRIKEVGYNEGAIGLISNTIEGISLSSLIRKNNELKGKDQLGEERMSYKTKMIVQEMALGNTKRGGDAGMVPVVNHQNEIIDYKIQMPKEMKLRELDQENDIADVLSNTYSRSVKTALTAEFNKDIVDVLINYAAQNTDRLEDFVLIEEYTEDMKEEGIPREKRHDQWDILPEHTKEYIHKQLGQNGILIDKRFVDMMVGSKELTIGNWTKGIDLRKHPVARARLVALESYIKEILGTMKRAMILLNGDIIKGNIISNAYVAQTHGVRIDRYVKSMKRYWNELDMYVELDRKRNDLEVEAKTGKDVARKIARIEEQMSRHYVLDLLVKDGQFSPIAEDINVDDKPNGELEGYLQDAINSSKFSGVLNGLKNVLYINKDSKLGRLAIKNVTYQDTLTRATILEHLLKELANKKGYKSIEDIPMSEVQPVLDYTDQLLINYGYKMNEQVAYSEKVLGVMFLRYYLGAGKAIWSMTKKNPLANIGGELVQAVSIDVANPLDSIWKNPINAIINRSMLMEAPGEVLYPNLFDLMPSLSLR